MRCLPPKFNIVDPYREVCIAMFSHLFGGHYMSDLHLWQTAISPSLGGFGLRFFEEYHYSAYLASSMQCLSFLGSGPTQNIKNIKYNSTIFS